MTKLQKAYALSLKKVTNLEGQAVIQEKAYIQEQGIKNSDGSIPEHIWMLDKELFNLHNEAFCSISEVQDSYKQLEIARKALHSAENDLLEAAICVIPNSETRISLNNGIHTFVNVRKEMLDLAMRLDFSTVPSHS